MVFSRIWKNGSPTVSESSTVTLYRSCNDLPLDRFITCLCTGEYTSLIITGYPLLPDLFNAWSEIYAQYIDLESNGHAIYINNLRRDFMLVAAKIDLITAIIRALAIVPNDKDLIAMLHKRRFKYKFDILDQPGFQRDLERVAAHLAPLRITYAALQKELDALEQKPAERVKPEFFTTILVRLSKFMGYQVRAQAITVAEYLAMCKDYTNTLKSQNGK